MKKVTYEKLLSMFFDEKFDPPCKKGEKFKMDGKNYICTESSDNAFEFRGIKDPSDYMTLGRF